MPTGMNINSPGRILAVFLALLLFTSGYLFYRGHRAERAAAGELAVLLAGAEREALLGERTKSTDCMLRGTLPDPACTPGAVFPDATREHICRAGYTQTVRNVPQKLREAVFAEYGIPYPQPRGTFEVDHLIPLAIGGSNDIANLFPQPAAEIGFREKDVVEVYMQEEVCAERVALGIAQERIAENWQDIFNRLAPERVEQIKTAFSNWSE